MPIPIRWEGARLSDDGKRLRLVHIHLQPPDRADIRWEPRRITVTLSRMDFPRGSTSAVLQYHCVELELSRDASDLILVDGATGERATAKRSRYLDPDDLRAIESSPDRVFEPDQFLVPREVEGDR